MGKLRDPLRLLVQRLSAIMASCQRHDGLQSAKHMSHDDDIAFGAARISSNDAASEPAFRYQ